MTTKELENYTPKGQLEGFPKEIIAHMLECQKEQVDRRDVTVFENLTRACPDIHGFSWNKTKEGYDFWRNIHEEACGLGLIYEYKTKFIKDLLYK